MLATPLNILKASVPQKVIKKKLMIILGIEFEFAFDWHTMKYPTSHSYLVYTWAFSGVHA